jgi:hypothetical protein
MRGVLAAVAMVLLCCSAQNGDYSKPQYRDSISRLADTIFFLPGSPRSWQKSAEEALDTGKTTIEKLLSIIERIRGNSSVDSVCVRIEGSVNNTVIGPLGWHKPAWLPDLVGDSLPVGALAEEQLGVLGLARAKTAELILRHSIADSTVIHYDEVKASKAMSNRHAVIDLSIVYHIIVRHDVSPIPPQKPSMLERIQHFLAQPSVFKWALYTIVVLIVFVGFLVSFRRLWENLAKLWVQILKLAKQAWEYLAKTVRPLGSKVEPEALKPQIAVKQTDTPIERKSTFRWPWDKIAKLFKRSWLMEEPRIPKPQPTQKHPEIRSKPKNVVWTWLINKINRALKCAIKKVKWLWGLLVQIIKWVWWLITAIKGIFCSVICWICKIILVAAKWLIEMGACAWKALVKMIGWTLERLIKIWRKLQNIACKRWKIIMLAAKWLALALGLATLGFFFWTFHPVLLAGLRGLGYAVLALALSFLAGVCLYGLFVMLLAVLAQRHKFGLRKPFDLAGFTKAEIPDTQTTQWFDLSNYMPPIGDQEKFCSCVAWAGVALVAFKWNYYRKVNGDDPKAICPYHPMYTYLGICHGADKGSTLAELRDFLHDTGLAYLPGVSVKQAWPQMNPLPELQLRHYKVDKDKGPWKWVDMSDVDGLKKHLLNGNPILVSMRVWSNFFYSDIYSTSDGLEEGLHALVLCGYDDIKNSFKIRNSWGVKWGEEGYGWITYNFARRVCRQGAILDWVPDGRISP